MSTIATCGACGRSWDDGVVTSMTPVPSGRCPFEYFHDGDPVPEDWPVRPIEKENIMVATDGTDTIANAPVKAQENIDGLIDAVGLAAILERVAERVRRRDEEQRQEIGALREELAKQGSRSDLRAAIDAVEVEIDKAYDHAADAYSNAEEASSKAGEAMEYAGEAQSQMEDAKTELDVLRRMIAGDEA